MLKKQSGMTFIGFVIVAAIAISLILAGVKIVPAYIEFSGVKKIINSIGSKPEFDSMNKKEIMEAFDKGAATGYVTVVNSKDLIFSKDSNGKNVVSIEYEVVTPLAFNLSALMDFKASTEK
ncbi:MAG TPA: DUF4845 domain-containing protein [Methylophilaceae bacterium]|nr:DUF4845 domain-containing protein [Methylophilaceae bacterium]